MKKVLSSGYLWGPLVFIIVLALLSFDLFNLKVGTETTQLWIPEVYKNDVTTRAVLLDEIINGKYKLHELTFEDFQKFNFDIYAIWVETEVDDRFLNIKYHGKFEADNIIFFSRFFIKPKMADIAVIEKYTIDVNKGEVIFFLTKKVSDAKQFFTFAIAFIAGIIASLCVSPVISILKPRKKT